MLTPEPGSHFFAVWSPDGRRVAFSRFEATNPALSVKNADGNGEIEALTEPSEDAQFPNSWSPDGKTSSSLVGYPADSRTETKAPLDGPLARLTRRPAVRAALVREPFRESGGAFSPDGRWIAYVSDESEVREIYVRPYPGPGAPSRCRRLRHRASLVA